MSWTNWFSPKSKVDKHAQAFIKKAFGYTPKDTTLYLQALRHSSAATKINSQLKNSNERLEFLGDAVLDSIIAHYLYNKFLSLPEGELTKMKSKVVRRDNLNMIGYSLGIVEELDLKLGNQEMHDSIVGNAMEALIGALYLDRGFDDTREIVIRILKKQGLDNIVHDDVDYKSKLHEWSQKYKRTLQYKVVEHRNENGSSFYKVSLMVDDHEHGLGSGNSKKSAEQNAAKMASENLHIRPQK
ncbi:MAG: ribonuclease III [Flavobacteriales bacterium]|nr:ribonuclease III [Flavobacteriales bacterium]